MSTLEGRELAIWEHGFMVAQHGQDVTVSDVQNGADHFYRVAFDSGFTPESPSWFVEPDPAPLLAIIQSLAAAWAPVAALLAAATDWERRLWVEGFAHGSSVPSLALVRARHARERFSNAAFGPPPPTADGPTHQAVTALRDAMVAEAVAQTESGRSLAPGRPMVADARAAASLLRESGVARDALLAAHLEAAATYWQRWATPEPTSSDLTLLALIRHVLGDADR